MWFWDRIPRSSAAVRWQAGHIIRRMVILALVVLVIGRWITGNWTLWPLLLPGLIGLWWLGRVIRRAVRYVRGYGYGPTKYVPRWARWHD